METTQFTTKEDLKQLELALRRDLQKIEKKLDEKLDKVMNLLDGIAGRLDDLSTDNEIGTYQTRELNMKVDDHEKRLQLND